MLTLSHSTYLSAPKHISKRCAPVFRPCAAAPSRVSTAAGTLLLPSFRRGPAVATFATGGDGSERSPPDTSNSGKSSSPEGQIDRSAEEGAQACEGGEGGGEGSVAQIEGGGGFKVGGGGGGRG